MFTLTCYGCEDIARSCCGSAAVEECFSGLLIDDGVNETLIYAPFDLYVNTTGALVADRYGHYATIAVSGTSYATSGDLYDYLSACAGGGEFRVEYTGISGFSFTFTGNNAHIPSDRDKIHLLIDGREKVQAEYSISGNTITTTFRIFPDNRIIFWYRLY